MTYITDGIENDVETERSRFNYLIIFFNPNYLIFFNYLTFSRSSPSAKATRNTSSMRSTASSTAETCTAGREREGGTVG
jgi:hypothetical protein